MLKSSAALRRFNKIGLKVGFNTGMAEWVCSGSHMPSYKLLLSNFSFVSNVFCSAWLHSSRWSSTSLFSRKFFHTRSTWSVVQHECFFFVVWASSFPPLFGRPRPRKVLSSQSIFSSSRTVRLFNSLKELFQSTACLH